MYPCGWSVWLEMVFLPVEFYALFAFRVKVYVVKVIGSFCKFLVFPKLVFLHPAVASEANYSTAIYQ